MMTMTNPYPPINRNLSQRLEACIAQSHRSTTLHFQVSGERGGILDLGLGGAFYSGAESPLSQVMGWGFGERDTAELDTIESFYRSHSMTQCSIELSPFVGGEYWELLSNRGYSLTEVSQISILALEQRTSTMNLGAVEILPLSPGEELAWSRVVAEGFGAANLAPVFSHYAAADGIFAFGAWVDGVLAGGGTIALHDQVGDLGVTSTLPKYRGRGVQKALLQARLDFAREQGAELAVVTTDPGSISDANIQKIGFRPAYTRMHLQKSL